MPTFTAIALDRLIEPGASKAMAAGKSGPDSKLARTISTPNGRSDRSTKASNPKIEKSISVHNAKTSGRDVTSTANEDRQRHWIQISPALYATPKPTPLPDSPSSFPPSPYIINHKRRGPRLLKSFSQDDVAVLSRALNEKENENTKYSEKDVDSAAKNESFAHTDVVESSKRAVALTVLSPVKEEHANGVLNDELRIIDLQKCSTMQNGVVKVVTFNMQQNGEGDDFSDPQESNSIKSNADSENNYGPERSANVSTPMVEFYDAWEELSSESGPQQSMTDLEAELHDVRLSLLMEIEKRKQADEELSTMRARWQKIREELSVVGLRLPVDPIAVSEDEEQNSPAKELSQQIFLARFVSNSIGRGTAKAEVEMEMEAQLELKSFEITRLLDRLHYYEAVNREMSQRNQETVEAARRLRQRSKRRQRLIWGSIAGAFTVGATVLAWSYLRTERGSSSPNSSSSPEVNHASER